MSAFQTDQLFQPSKIYIEESVAHTEWTQRILSKYQSIPQVVIHDANYLIQDVANNLNTESWKRNILLAKQRGPFLRLCPGTQNHICCMYHNLDVAAGCDLGCTYCILQGYLNTPLITFYCNIDDMVDELNATLQNHPKQFYRIGTGELSDSLTFEHISEMGPLLVNYFADTPNAIIELKSKSVQIEQLLNLRHNRRTVVSWSMNSQYIQQTEEKWATSLSDRILAAQEIQKAGYRIGFHFDPMIRHEGWQEQYRDIIDDFFKVIRPENIAWISLGALRYPAVFDEIVRENHPTSDIYLGELLPGIDKKLRYFRPLRVEMFNHMYKWIRFYSQEVFVYLCMESRQVWQQSFGWAPKSSAHLKRLLDDRVRS